MNVSIRTRVIDNNAVLYEIPLTFKDDVLESLLYGDDGEWSTVSPTTIKCLKKEILSVQEMELLTQTTDEDTMTGTSGIADGLIFLGITEKFQKLLNKQIYKCFVNDFIGEGAAAKEAYFSDGMKEYYFFKYLDLVASINQLIGILKIATEKNYQIQLISALY
jgi:hypothetical protein